MSTGRDERWGDSIVLPDQATMREHGYEVVRSGGAIREALDSARVFGSRVYPEAFAETATYEDRVRATKEYMLYLVDEVGEVLRELNWKAHREERMPYVRTNLLEELIDVLKFWAGVASLWGFTEEEIGEELSRKTDVVFQRYAQERALSGTTQQLVIVDIDGVLADYPASFERFAGRPLSSLSGVERARLKHEYRERGFEGNYVAPRPEAAEFVRRLRDWGYFVVALTSRPYSRYKRMFGDTLAFMRRHGIEVDAIVFEDDKAGFVLRQMDAGKIIALFVDDEEEHVRKVGALGVAAHRLVGDLLDIVRIRWGGGGGRA